MKEADYQKLRETSWRRRLTPEEEARLRSWLTSHPETQADWEEDASLNALLDELPDAPVAGNFTGRVLQSVDRLEAARARQARLDRSGWRRLLRWMPQTATVMIVAAVSVTGYRILQQKQARQEVAPGVELAQTMSALPNPDSLRDFNAIQQLSAVPRPVDFELLEALE